MSPSAFFLVFPIFFFLIKSNAAYEDVAVLFGENHCHPPSPCKKGNFEIKYPFWKLDDSSSTVCGYPGFGIDCSNPDPDFPLLYLSDDSFLVKEINYDEFSVTLADADAYKKECPRARHNFTLTQKSPLLYDHKDLNLTFYFNCTKNPLPAAYPIDCLKSDPKASYLYVGAFNPYNWDWLGICEAKVETTVIETGEVINDKNFGRDMSNGFKLNWQPLDDCAHCDIPKGWCEQDNHFREFLCFCENGTTVIVPDCPSKGMYHSRTSFIPNHFFLNIHSFCMPKLPACIIVSSYSLYTYGVYFIESNIKTILISLESELLLSLVGC
nr:LEAF RUST 10 DISEASE-RESISTANCE LOCUS RECEPTOR-LIKE PROTEIN KINASE-like 1.2 isoform X2 [Ipomoea batatas]